MQFKADAVQVCYKRDGDPVTRADHAANEALQKVLPAIVKDGSRRRLPMTLTGETIAACGS